jgi:hypothetical protein
MITKQVLSRVEMQTCDRYKISVPVVTVMSCNTLDNILFSELLLESSKSSKIHSFHRIKKVNLSIEFLNILRIRI